MAIELEEIETWITLTGFAESAKYAYVSAGSISKAFIAAVPIVAKYQSPLLAKLCLLTTVVVADCTIINYL